MNKLCAICNIEYPLTSEYFGKCDSCKSGYYRYCKPCANIQSKKSALKYQKKHFNQDGFITEKDHFNAALIQLAEVMNKPSLLKHLK